MKINNSVKSEKMKYDLSLPLAFKIVALFECTIEQIFEAEAEDLA